MSKTIHIRREKTPYPAVPLCSEECKDDKAIVQCGLPFYLSVFIFSFSLCMTVYACILILQCVCFFFKWDR